MRRERVTRDSMWGSQHKGWIKIRDLEDTHLANIIKYLNENFEPNQWHQAMLEEANIRGLSVKFLDRAYIPFKDEYGVWRLWNQEKFDSIAVSK